MLIDTDTGNRSDTQRVADLRLRGTSGPLKARVTWPLSGTRGAAAPLLVFFAETGLGSGASRRAEALCRELCARAGIVVLSTSHGSVRGRPYSSAYADGMTALEWAADHASELGADPSRLLVGGHDAGASLAATLALHARDNRWPMLTRQLLIHPHLDDVLRAASLQGVAPATIVTAGAGGARDDGRDFAGRLRAAGVPVDERRHDRPAIRWWRRRRR